MMLDIKMSNKRDVESFHQLPVPDQQPDEVFVAGGGIGSANQGMISEMRDREVGGAVRMMPAVNADQPPPVLFDERSIWSNDPAGVMGPDPMLNRYYTAGYFSGRTMNS